MSATSSRYLVGMTLVAFLAGWPPAAAAGLEDAERATVDNAVRSVMQRNNIPGVSIALVRHREIAYAEAYGLARVAGPRIPVRRQTRFAIGSITKEFVAACVLLLADRGKLSLDDPVARFLPGLTDARKVTIRELLNHTAGYRDYFLQEYIPARTQRPTTVDAILKGWAERPQDFSPGSEWQYSSTNYVIAGRIVEIASGKSLDQFLTDNVLRPIGIVDATFEGRPLGSVDEAVGYLRFALGPPHIAPLAGQNWLFAMADLRMTASDVALWDISVLRRSLLSRQAYAAMETQAHTSNGVATGYGLGLFVGTVQNADGRRGILLRHPGEISGFRAANFILPGLDAAVVILTNAEYSDSTNEIARGIQQVVGVAPASDPGAQVRVGGAENVVEQRARRVVQELTRGIVERRQFSADAAAVFTAQALRDIRRSLAPLGPLLRVQLDSVQARGGTTHYALTLRYHTHTLQIAEYDCEDGTIEQFFIDR